MLDTIHPDAEYEDVLMSDYAAYPSLIASVVAMAKASDGCYVAAAVDLGIGAKD